MKFMTIITLMLTDSPLDELDCNGPLGREPHDSLIFASRSDALEWLDANQFKPTDEKAVFRRGRFTTAIISSIG